MSWIDLKAKIKWLHQTKKYRNIEFHKFKLWDATNQVWYTYWYIDEIDIKRLTKPSDLDKRLYKIR